MSLLEQMKGGKKGKQAIQNRDNEDILRRIISPKCPIDPYELLGERSYKAPRIVPKEETGTSVQEFFRDATIFLTGATGFLGLVLIEKLLRCCPHVNKIYLLIRVKRNKPPSERFDSIFHDRLFDRLKHEVPNFREKLFFMCGNVDQPRLGLSEEDRNKIVNEVNIIYHCAATVRFNEKLARAIKLNTMGTREMIRIAKDVKSLKAFLHVSTAYSFCNHVEVDEKLYPMHIDPESMIKLVEQKPAEELENEISTYLKDWPNTYVFSKALAEWLIQKEASDLPVGIYRPSIVISTIKEPLRGWINNIYGPLGLILGFALGILHVYDGDLNDETIDMVPVDMVVNSLICATREVALNHKTKANMNDEVPIYNFANGDQSPTTWKHISDIGMQEVVKNWALSDAIWYPSYISVTCSPLYSLLSFVLHKIPGYIIDFLCILIKREPVLTNMYGKLDELRDKINYFKERKWLFKMNNMKGVWKNLSAEDKEIFFFDIRELNWTNYAQIYALGVRVFIMNDDIQTLPAARKKLKRLYVLHQVTKMLFYAAILVGLFFLFRLAYFRLYELL